MKQNVITLSLRRGMFVALGSLVLLMGALGCNNQNTSQEEESNFVSEGSAELSEEQVEEVEEGVFDALSDANQKAKDLQDELNRKTEEANEALMDE